jgi:hypothetical protein
LILHVLLSLAILSPPYYPKFFGPATLNATGEITILAGVLATYCLWAARREPARQVLLAMAVSFLGVHLVSMGWNSWLQVGEWPGKMPPISMLSFLLAGGSLALLLQGKESPRRG